MLNINMEGSRAYSQHFQIIFSCVLELHDQHKYKTHVFQSFSVNTNINHSCAPELLTQHKTSHQSCALGSMPNKNKHTYTHTHTHTYIYHQQFAYAQYIKQIIVFIGVGSSTQYIKIKHQDNIIINRLMPLSVRSKIQDITFVEI